MARKYAPSSRSPSQGVAAWWRDLVQKVIDLLTLPDRPELIPIPVEKDDRRRRRSLA